MANSTKPLLPSLLPRLVDPLWHKVITLRTSKDRNYCKLLSNRDFAQVDQPRDENLELARLEREQEQRMKAITKSYMDVPPIGELLPSRISSLWDILVMPIFRKNQSGNH